jgi:hypothetical protein
MRKSALCFGLLFGSAAFAVSSGRLGDTTRETASQSAATDGVSFSPQEWAILSL